MYYTSTRRQSPLISFRDALFSGLAPDGGLYFPVSKEELFVPLSPGTIVSLRRASLLDTATVVASHFFGDEIPQQALSTLLADALNFPVPLVKAEDNRWVLELFHGPTFAFKDIGARVMARLMAHFNDEADPLTVLVATSGDTGSAVAQAFFGVAGTRVVVLFPEGQVTPIQEAQFTTLGGNITAIAVDGSFDDCQRVVKEAFGDPALSASQRLTSANSINIGRLLPQVFYYVYVAGQFAEGSAPIFSVPSGNFGNLTAGLIAKRLGARIHGFVAATTVNDAGPRFLATGMYEPRPSIRTLANAMDVGDPTNLERIRFLYGDDLDAMRRDITSSVHTDDEVRRAIADVWRRTGYLCDPHTTIAYLGTLGTSGTLVFLATAHPAKFREVVEPIIGETIPLPAPLAAALGQPRQVQRIGPNLRDLRAYLQ